MSKPEFIESKNCYHCRFYGFEEVERCRFCNKHDFCFDDLDVDAFLVGCEDWRSTKLFKVEFETMVDHIGQVHLTRNREELVYQLTESCAGKKVKVTIEEIEEDMNNLKCDRRKSLDEKS